MVKVISAYNFQQQNTHAAFGDIVATCMIGTDRLALAHRNFIEIHLLEGNKSESLSPEYITKQNIKSQASMNPCKIHQHFNSDEEKIMFPTIDEVSQLMYCTSKNYLLTFEYKSDGQQSQLSKQRTFVRVYTNFEIANSNCFSVPIRARIASKITPNAIPNKHIEVIEIPMNDLSPHLVTCCQTSGTIAVCCGHLIIIFESRYCITDATKAQYLDFFEAPFYVNLGFKPYKIALAEHVITCMNYNTVVAFKIMDLEDGRSDHGTASNSLEIGSSSSIHCQGTRTTSSNEHQYLSSKSNQAIDFNLAKKCNEANGLEIQSSIQSNWEREKIRRPSFSEDRPFLVNDVKIKLVNKEAALKNNYILKSLVQLRLQHDNTKKNLRNREVEENVRGKVALKATTIYDEFRCLALKPIYMKFHKTNCHSRNHNFEHEEKDSHASQHIMKSDLHKYCVGFSLLISTVSDGYVYQFTNLGKWYAENLKCLAVYPFTSPVIDVVIDSFVIHAITENGIETFSSRIGHKMFSSYFEYPMINFPYPNQASPLVDVPICVMGICGFFGIKYVAFSSRNLVLLTSDCEITSRTQKNQELKLSAVSQTTRKKQTEWTIYDLELPRAEKLVDDISNLAQIYQRNSFDMYYELLEEAHVIIRLAKELLFPSNIFNTVSNHLPCPDENYEITIDKSFKKSCKMLADFTIRSSQKETYSQAAAYYNMCQHSILDIYTGYNESNNVRGHINEDNHEGLIYTLTLLLSQIVSNKCCTEILSQTLPSNFSCFGKENTYKTTESIPREDRIFADELFDLYMKYSPNDLTRIALRCSAFREILNDRICQLYYGIGKIEELDPKQKICFTLCLCYKKNVIKAKKVFETLRRSQLFAVLCDSWEQVLFENLHLGNFKKYSFSDFTESILFKTEREDLIQASADAVINILTIEQDVDLFLIIKLFLNYFAMNVGCAGYKTSQKILEIVLQAYLNDLYENNKRNVEISINNYKKRQELETCNVNNISQPSKDSCLFRDVKDHLQSSIIYKVNVPYTTRQDKDPDTEAIKLLFRIYLGLLKQFTVDEQSSEMKTSDISKQLPNVNDYRLTFIDYLYRNKHVIKIGHIKPHTNTFSYQKSHTHLVPILPDYNLCNEDTLLAEDNYWRMTQFKRPILFFDLRESFLDKMTPLSHNAVETGVGWQNDEISLVLIKIQSLLNSGKLVGVLLEDAINFLNTEPNIIGVDSILILLLPIPEGSQFLIHTNPTLLLEYTKVRFTSCYQWRMLFEQLLEKKREIQALAQQSAIEIYDNVMEDILRYLVITKTLEEFSECIPDPALYNTSSILANNTSLRKHTKYETISQDGIDETNPFELMMREAVVKQRSDSLYTMIKSSGRQLNDAVNNFHLSFN